MIIVKTGRAVPEARAGGHDFEHWFAAGVGDAFDYRVVRVDAGQSLPPLASLSPSTAVLVTGSPAMVSHREDWSERAAGWLADAHAADRCVLGVCYGHQLLAHALGGRVGPNPNGRRMGRVPVSIDEPEDPLLGGMGSTLSVHVSHVESVLEPPAGARVIATAPHDPHHALYFGGRTWGVQFHPEFDAPVMRAYLRARSDVLRDEGFDVEALIDDVDTGHDGPAVLARFARLAGEDRDHQAA